MNKYKRWYDQIIERARGREMDGYSEVHHVVPRSMGGSNRKDNLVRLTYREHFLAHWLLVKFTTGKDQTSMRRALGCMSGGHGNSRPTSSWQYKVLRASAREVMMGRKRPQSEIDKTRVTRAGYRHSEETKALIGASNKGKGRKVGYHHTEETKRVMSVKAMGNKRGIGRKLSQEQINKLRAGHKKWWGDPGTRKISDQHLRKLREGHKRYWENKRAI